MTAASEHAIAEATRWLVSEASRLAYGEAGLRLVVHRGEVTRIERVISEKEVVEP